MNSPTALLLLDLQDGLLAMPGIDPDPLLAKTSRAVAAMRERGATIVHIGLGFTEEDWAAVPASNPTFSLIAEHRLMRHDDPATAFRLTPEPGDITIRKTRVGALSTTDLDRRLRDRGTTTLILAGLTTSGAVLSTLTDAADRDYRLRVLSDAVADPDPVAHAALMGNVFPRMATMINTTVL